jgi:DNA-binding MarR family transcriptional regulator
LLSEFLKIILATKIKVLYQEEEKLSSDSQQKRAEILGDLTRELRQFNELGVSFLRMAAAKRGMTVTDMQVIDLLEGAGPMTAGQLADLTGLTTGAITGMLNRLEEAGLVSRERDPSDGRRVIVRLIPGNEGHNMSPVFASFRGGWEELVSGYDDEQIAFLLEFLKRTNALSRQEIARLREASGGEGRTSSALLGDLESARLVVSSSAQLTLRTGEEMVELYQARFEGSVPNVTTKEGVVTIHYPRRLSGLMGEQRQAVVTLSRAIPWQIVIQSGGTDVTAELGGLDLASFEIKGGGSRIHLHLPVPSGVVPIRISGGGSEIVVRRPAGVAVQAHLKGWGSVFVFDDQTHMGNDVRLQSSGFEPTTPYYNIEVASSGSMVTITSG